MSQLDQEMSQLAREAVQVAKDSYGVTLDGSPESVERVETILAAIHEEYAKTPIPDETLHQIAFLWGAYIGETLRSVKSGEWQEDSESAGKGIVPFVTGDGEEVFAVMWVYKRILDGESDNVWVKFGLVTGLLKTVPLNLDPPDE